MVEIYYPAATHGTARNALLNVLRALPADKDDAIANDAVAVAGSERRVLLPEVDALWRLLVAHAALDRRAVEAARGVCDAALELVRADEWRRRRSLEPLAWRIEQLAALCAERVGFSSLSIFSCVSLLMVCLCVER